VCDADRAATQGLHRVTIARWLAGSTVNSMAMPRSSSNACNEGAVRVGVDERTAWS
jgi:hypothetical protein